MIRQIGACGTFRSLLVLIATWAVCSVVPPGSVVAAELGTERINSAEFTGKSPPADAITPLTVKLQVLLDRAGFSPGEIDGKLGENTQKALRAFAEAQQLPGTIKLTQEVWQRLAADTRPVLTEYTITARDV